MHDKKSFAAFKWITTRTDEARLSSKILRESTEYVKFFHYTYNWIKRYIFRCSNNLI